MAEHAHAAGRGSGVLDRRTGRARAGGAGTRQFQPVAVATDAAARAGARAARRAALPGPLHPHPSPLSSRLMQSAQPPAAPVLCLASVSPRRRELLAQIGVPCVVSAADIDEAVGVNERAADYVVRMGCAKALAVRSRGVALAHQGGVAFRLSTSEVRLRVLSRAECRAYWASGEPHDKAGGYAVQGRGAVFIEHLSGSHSGGVGLRLLGT